MTEDSQTARWPYRLQWISESLLEWRATLCHGDEAVALVLGRMDGGAADLDLAFEHPEREAAFLIWLRDVPLPDGVAREAEAVVQRMYQQASAETDTRMLGPRSGMTDAEALFGLVRGLFGETESPEAAPQVSRVPPLAFHAACTRAMRLHKAEWGTTIEFGETIGDAGFELSSLGLGTLRGLPPPFDPEQSKRTVWHLMVVLANIATRFEHTSAGAMRKEEQARLHDEITTLYGDVDPTVLGLSEVTDECEHAVMLRAMCLTHSSIDVYNPHDDDELTGLIVLAVALMRALTVLGMDVNAELSSGLSSRARRKIAKVQFFPDLYSR